MSEKQRLLVDFYPPADSHICGIMRYRPNQDLILEYSDGWTEAREVDSMHFTSHTDPISGEVHIQLNLKLKGNPNETS